MACPSIRQYASTTVFTGALLLSACGGGGSADGGAAMPATAPDDGPPAQALASHGAITIDEPRAEVSWIGTGGTGRVQVHWQAEGGLSPVSAWVSPREGAPFAEVPTQVNGPQVTFEPGTSWRLDFPTARVRVRGCGGTGGACADSNVQPLAEALVAARPDLVAPVDPSASARGGSSQFVIDDAGTTIAALRTTDMGMYGSPPENFSPARLDVYVNQGMWSGAQSYPTPDFRTGTYAVALSGDGNTMAIPLLYSYGGYAPIGIPGAVVVYYNELDEFGSGRTWRLGAVISAPAATRVVEFLGAALALSDDGRRLAAVGHDSVFVFERQADGQWQFLQQIPGATTRRLAMSGDGNVIAFGSVAGSTPVPQPGGGSYNEAHHEVRVHACDGNAWPLQATLRSDAHPYAGADTLDDFGSAGLALSDDGRTLAVGAPRRRSGTQPGSVYLFEQAGAAGWQRRGRLANDAETAPDLLGLDLALSGDGRVLAASACGALARASGVNRNHAQASPPVSDEPCNVATQRPGQSHGAHVFERTGPGAGARAWGHAAQAVPVLPPHPQFAGHMSASAMVPLLNRDGRTLGLGAYRDADDTDGRPGMTTLRIY